MSPGDLDRRVTILAAAMTDSAYGPVPGEFAPIPKGVRVPAQVEDVLVAKSEQVIRGLRVANSPAQLRMRWRDDIRSNMRVVVHGKRDRTYEIVAGPTQIGRREWVEFAIVEYTT